MVEMAENKTDLVLLEEAAEKQDLGSGKGEEDKEDEQGLKPWEQHSAVISLPRFDYKAPSALLERSYSGFLITCPIKREKSATKEAISILEEHIGFVDSNEFETSIPCSRDETAKRRKVCLPDDENIDSSGKSMDRNRLAHYGEAAKEVNLPSVADENAKGSPSLSLVKLTKSGLLLFTLPSSNSYQVIDIVTSIFRSLGSAAQKLPKWCHRVFPIQETCCLTEEDLQNVVTKLVMQYLSFHNVNLERTIKFAVGYNRRGIEDIEMKREKCASGITLLERNRCFEVVAGTFKKIVENSKVDLKTPEVVVLVEVLPISGIPLDSLVVGVSVLPCELVTTKPRLCIKPLARHYKRGKEAGV